MQNSRHEGCDFILGAIKAWYLNLPLCTKSTLSFISGVYLISLLMGFTDVHTVCLLPSAIVQHLEVWRILTGVVVHGDLLHIAFNMFVFVPISQSLERLMGTVMVSYLLLMLALLAGLLYVAAAYAVWFLGVYPLLLQTCAVGYSGIIFGLIVIDNAQSGATHRSILGLFSVPAQFYPWALLVVWQVIMPSVSFLGHLSGLLVGEMWVRGRLHWLQLRYATASKIESHPWVHRHLVPQPSFVKLPTNPGGLPISTQDGSAAHHYPGHRMSQPTADSSSGTGFWGRSSGSFSQMFRGAAGTSQPSPAGHVLGAVDGSQMSGPSTGGGNPPFVPLRTQDGSSGDKPPSAAAAAAAAAEARAAADLTAKADEKLMSS